MLQTDLDKSAHFALFIPLDGRLHCFPLAGVARVRGKLTPYFVRDPEGIFAEYPDGPYAVADSDGQTHWVGVWTEAYMKEVARQIECRRIDACEQRAATVMH